MCDSVTALLHSLSNKRLLNESIILTLIYAKYSAYKVSSSQKFSSPVGLFKSQIVQKIWKQYTYSC